MTASASKGIPFRYYDQEQREIMYVDNYIPSIGIEKAVITKPDLKFRYAASVIANEFDSYSFYLNIRT